MSYLYVIKKKYNKNNTVKIGSTINFAARLYNYITPEDDFDNTTHDIWMVTILYSIYNCYQLDNIIQYSSTTKNIPYVKYNGTGGKEHYKFTDISYLEEFLISLGVKYNIEKIDIDTFIKSQYYTNNYNIPEPVIPPDIFDVATVCNNTYMKRPHQQNILNAATVYYKNNNIGRLYLACGTGKTLIGCWIAQMLMATKIYIIVPSIQLLSQTLKTWLTMFPLECNYKYIVIGSDVDKSFKTKATTDEADIIRDIVYDKLIVLSTYQSSNLLDSVAKKTNTIFNFGIYDEAHRCVGDDYKNNNILVKSNIATKKLFMTATEKIIKPSLDSNIDTILSMDDEKCYGEVIAKYSMRQAIVDKILVDYKIIAPYIICDDSNYNDYSDYKKYDMYTILTGVMIVMAMISNNIKRMLVFSTDKESAQILCNFINEFKKNKSLRCVCLFGDNSIDERKKEIDIFTNSESAIICSVRIFSEGVDIKACDGITIAGNKSSPVEIVQCVGRCLRKYDKVPNKIAHILIPCIVDDPDMFFESNNQQFKKLRCVLNTIATTDDTICNKVTITNYNKNKQVIIKNKAVKEIININVDKYSEWFRMMLFDKTGKITDEARQMINDENANRFCRDMPYICTRRDYNKYLRKHNMAGPNNINNWVEYCLGGQLFNKEKNKYCNDLKQFVDICHKHNIYTAVEYKNKYICDERLPPYDYIDSGFYCHLNPKFNLEYLIGKGTNIMLDMY